MFVKLTGPPEPTLFYFCGESRFSRQKNATRKAGTLRSTIFYKDRPIGNIFVFYAFRTFKDGTNIKRLSPTRFQFFRQRRSDGKNRRLLKYRKTLRRFAPEPNRKHTQMRIEVSPGPRRDLMINRPCFSCNEDINRIGFIRAR